MHKSGSSSVSAFSVQLFFYIEKEIPLLRTCYTALLWCSLDYRFSVLGSVELILILEINCTEPTVCPFA